MLRAAHAFKWASSGNEPVRIFTRSATDGTSPRRVTQRAREWMCPTSNFGNAGRNFCVVKSCQGHSIITNANRAVCARHSWAKSLTALGINQARAAYAGLGISEIDSDVSVSGLRLAG
jgi:hypothetical protein